MEDAVTQRVNELRDKDGLSVRAFAIKLGMLQETLNKQLKEGGRGVSVSTIVLILDVYPNLSAEWLLRGEGTMERAGTPSRSDGTTIADLRDNIASLKEVNALLREKIAMLEGEKDNMEGDRLVSMAAETMTYNKK